MVLDHNCKTTFIVNADSFSVALAYILVAAIAQNIIHIIYRNHIVKAFRIHLKISFTAANKTTVFHYAAIDSKTLQYSCELATWAIICIMLH